MRWVARPKPLDRDDEYFQEVRLGDVPPVRHAHLCDPDQGLRHDPPAADGLEAMGRHEEQEGRCAHGAAVWPDDRRSRQQRAPGGRPEPVRGHEGDARKGELGLAGFRRCVRHGDPRLCPAQGVREGAAVLRGHEAVRRQGRLGYFQYAHRRLQPRRRHGGRRKALPRHDERRMHAGPDHLQHPHQGLLLPGRAGAGPRAVRPDEEEGHPARRHRLQQPLGWLREEAEHRALRADRAVHGGRRREAEQPLRFDPDQALRPLPRPRRRLPHRRRDAPEVRLQAERRGLHLPHGHVHRQQPAGLSHGPAPPHDPRRRGPRRENLLHASPRRPARLQHRALRGVAPGRVEAARRRETAPRRGAGAERAESLPEAPGVGGARPRALRAPPRGRGRRPQPELRRRRPPGPGHVSPAGRVRKVARRCRGRPRQQL
mmetsp:Transcript_114159/g.327990  ORF Transcript_114159/g.327990 Transcript_114159/m.327990 type:complete len:429 (-) Transcript_114159:268-1554(-)